ncbi:MAG TPA: ABC transporter permease [Candidatus Pacearchaeota archaeon]|nr:ABC transporter permease [Candidatus Pacearchaeota archaeon]
MIISKESVKYSLNNLKKRKSRSLLTIISILVGITTIFVFISFGLGLYNYTNSFVTGSSADKITVMPKGGMGVPGLDDTFSLTEADLRAVQRANGVYDAEGTKWGVAEVQQGSTKKYVFGMGYNPDKSMIVEFSNLKIIEGRELESGDYGKAVLGYNFFVEGKIFPREVELNNRIKVNGKEVTVIGFFDTLGNPQDDSSIYLTNDYFNEVFTDTTGYGMIIARADPNKLSEAVENIEKNLRKSREVEQGKEDFTVSSFEDLLESYTSVLNILFGFIFLIALISVFVSSINTANTMITSVLERTQEIGVMKSIGARNSEIFKIFLFESSVIGFVAGALGVLLGVFLTLIAKQILVQLGWSFLKPYYSFWMFFGCIAFATITGAVSGVFPALNATRVSPVKALRYE